jgi:hypothetical protein
MSSSQYKLNGDLIPNGGVSFGNDLNYKGAYIGIDMGQSIVMKSYTIVDAGNATRRPKSWKIYATNNNGCWNNAGGSWSSPSFNTDNGYDWVEIDMRMNEISTNNSTVFKLLTNNTPYRYYALHINTLVGGSTDGQLAEVREWYIYGYPQQNLVTQYPPSALAAYENIINGVTYRVCGLNYLGSDTTYAPWKAFDRNTGTRFVSDDMTFTQYGLLNCGGVHFANDVNFKGVYFGIDMGQVFIMNSYTITNNSSATGRVPRSWKVYATNDVQCWNPVGGKISTPTFNTEIEYGWIELDVQINQVNYTNNTVFYIPDNKGYRFFAFHVNAIRGSTGSSGGYYIDISEWNIFGYPSFTNSISYCNDIISIGTANPDLSNRLTVVGNTNISGNVGIGTSVTGARLHVAETIGTVATANTGSIILDHANNGGASSLTFRSAVNRGSDYAYIQYQDAYTVGGGGESSKLILGTQNDGDDNILLLPSGNVGINIDNPGYKLHVNGSTYVDTLYVGQPGGSGTIYLGGGHAYDGAYSHAFIHTRYWGGNESTEMLLFKGNDPASNGGGPDRIRLRAGAIALDTYNYATTDGAAENIRLYIDENGNVGIGITSMSYKLQVNGTLYAGDATLGSLTTTGNITTNGTISATGDITAAGDIISSYSDIRLKKVISPIENPLEKIMSISTFKYHGNEKAQEFNVDPNKAQLGVSAQDVKAVFPEVVSLAPFDTSIVDGNAVSKSGEEYLTVSYERLVPVLIECIKDLKKEVNYLRSIIDNK